MLQERAGVGIGLQQLFDGCPQTCIAGTGFVQKRLPLASGFLLRAAAKMDSSFMATIRNGSWGSGFETRQRSVATSSSGW